MTRGAPHVKMIVVSAGFHKTHVAVAAREASTRGLLSLAIMGAYPTRVLKRTIRLLHLDHQGRLARLLDREEGLPTDRLRALFVPELLYELARAVCRLPGLKRFSDRASVATWKLYGRLAARGLERAKGAGIYHFRAGFGQASVARARELGMLLLCDHQIAHPAVLEGLIENRGRLETNGADAASLHPLSRTTLDDLDSSDAVVVNSEFVRKTFLAAGWPPERVHVVYLGVDDNFLCAVPPVQAAPMDGPLRLLYAGHLEQRKGADVLAEALGTLRDVDWELRIAGPVEPSTRSRHRAFLDDERVTLLGNLRRAELAREMAASPVFVFPSYAEGSARVVFEALACGCYVITTPNSGSIVENGVHGTLIPPGEPQSLAAAIVDADRDRAGTAQIGARNGEVVAQRFRQVDYGDAMAALYRKLAAQR